MFIRTDFLHFIRYRFLLFAGLLPYCLGAAVAYHKILLFDSGLFLTGLCGLFAVLVGVEAFNEYYDWVLGSDRVFQLDQKPISKSKFYIGIAAFFVALLFAIYLTLKIGTGIAIFAAFGFIAAAGYLGSPFRFAYRGLGEVVIALAYGPAMVMGSYYLQTGRMDILPLVVSIIPAIFLFSIAIMNEVPDFLSDRLVGKKNICVRMGREKTVTIYGWLMVSLFVFSIMIMVLGVIPPKGWFIFLALPLAYRNYSTARTTLERPAQFFPSIRGAIIMYVLAVSILIVSFVV